MLKSYVFRILLVLLIVLGVNNGKYLMGNTYYSLSHEAFDGFVSPVSKTVDWVNLPANMHKSSFHDISSNFILDLPSYDSDILGMSLSSVGFSSENDVNIRNSKITYSVPYLGNYKLDGIQNAGSHPGVDVKLLKNTPLYSIANGIVVKSVKSNIGFGNYIVLLHKGVVDPKNPSSKTDIYSTYAHLDRILVDEGQVVSKGQMIAFSGNSGLATTAHLDFQINTKDVPFLPYWPFNVNEIAKDGYDFVSAVNSGIGYEDALKYTINPFEYIEKFKDFKWNTKILNSELDKYRVVEQSVEPVIEVALSAKLDLPTNEDDSLDKIKFTSINYPDKYLYINNSNLKIDFVGFFEPSKLKIESNLLDFKLLDEDKNNVSFELKPKSFGSEKIAIYYDGELISSKEIFISVFRDVSFDDQNNSFLKSLVDKKVLNGYLDGSIDLYSPISKVEAVVLISRLIDPDLGKNSDSWYQKQLDLAISLSAVNSNISLSESINLAEFLKITYKLLDVDISMSVHEFYSELFNVDAWYAPYVQEAYRKNILSTTDLLSLDQNLNRLQVFDLIDEFSNFIY